ncbi:MAG: DUF1320 domain-containing protein [Chitinophagales bacterium]|nr:DUF1320 domain-containing protein [Chitinophagales bacterium]
MAFLTPIQMQTHIYGTVSNVISKGNVAVMQDAINAAITEAKGYLSRYRVEQLFDNIDNEPTWNPDPILMMYVKNIAKWHFTILGNANIDLEDAEIRYNQAVKWLAGIQSGKIVPVNWPPVTPEENSSFFHFSSNPKRRNHY